MKTVFVNFMILVSLVLLLVICGKRFPTHVNPRHEKAPLPQAKNINVNQN